MQSFDPTLSPTALDAREREAIVTPGTIQPHGALVAIRASTSEIVQVSANVADFFAVAVMDWIGQPLAALWPESVCRELGDRLAAEPNARQYAWDFQLPARRPPGPNTLPERYQDYSAIVHRQGPWLMIEVEPKPATELHRFLWRMRAIADAIARIRSATTLAALVEGVARDIRKLTQFDRVMLYQFEADGSGEVIAENKQPHLPSYLGLHFPAADVPEAARELFQLHGTRAIPDVQAAAVPLVPERNPESNEPLDMTVLSLRSPSRCHVEYLTNIGARASLVMPLVVEQHLWGLIACHHYKPRHLDCETRKSCEFISQFVAVELAHQQEQRALAQRNRVKAIQTELHQALADEPEFIAAVLQRRQQEVLDLVQATGAALVLDGQLWQFGDTPSREQTSAIVAWLLANQRSELVATKGLGRDYPPAQEFAAIASGLLAASIFLNQASYHILWFRPEFARTVTWAGNPEETVTVTEVDGQPRLSPRHSFDCWQETVRGQARPWSAADLNAARELRDALLLAILEFSQSALQIAAERATLANQAKSQFLAKMSHELRTPLNAILGFAQMMARDRALSSEHRENINIIARSSEHLLLLINDVLEMSRIEAGHLQRDESDFDLHEAIAALHDLFAQRARDQGLTWTVTRSPNLPRYARGDERKLRQILINLIGNALKFTASGRIDLRLRASQLPPEGDACDTVEAYPFSLHFEVEDTGPGIPAEDFETIFEAFVQRPSERGNQHGTGLGLAISRQFARLLGGDIIVQSQVGQGTNFSGWVNLQAIGLRHAGANAPAPADPAAPSLAIAHLAAGQPDYRLLVVEDREEGQRLLVKLLTKAGFQVEVAADGQAAIERWETWQPHLIWIDLRMPGLDGCEATRRIRQRERESPERPRVKIVALTADALAIDRQAALQAGCDDLIAKPFQADELLAKLAEHLGVRYADQAAEFAPTLAKPPHLCAADFQGLPAEWCDRARYAAMAVDDRQLWQLVAELPDERADLRQALSQLLEDFRLDIILDLLETGSQ